MRHVARFGLLSVLMIYINLKTTQQYSDRLSQRFLKVCEGWFSELAVLTVITTVVTPLTNTQTGFVAGFLKFVKFVFGACCA